jgi:lysophospholipase L1-like esterase
MSYHRKKLLIIILVSLIVASSIAFFIFRPLPIYETTSIQPEEENIQAVINQVDEKDEEVQSNATDLSLDLKTAVEETLKIFTRTDVRITALGDSLTQGVGDETNNEGYIGVLNNYFDQTDTRVDIDNFGKRGNRTDQLLTRLTEEEAIIDSVEEADIVLITIGANDLMQVVKNNALNLNLDVFNEEEQAFETRLTEIIETINGYNPDAEIYLLGFFNPFLGYFDNVIALNEILTSWNQTGKRVIESYPNGHHIDVYDLFALKDISLLADDNFHPNQTGYTLIGARVYNHIKQTIEPLTTEMTSENDSTES